MSYGCGVLEDSWCSRHLVSCSNSHIIHGVMVVGPRRSLSLTGVMMLPQWWGTRRLMDRSRCPPSLTSPKRSHAWNWFCRYYLPVGPLLSPLFSLSLTAVYKIYLIIKTQNIHVLMRTLSTTDWCSVFMWCDSAALCMIDGAANARLWVFCCCFFFHQHAVLDDRQTVKDAPHAHCHFESWHGTGLWKV